jgi:sugar-specific transcriptional regulator TrmB
MVTTATDPLLQGLLDIGFTRSEAAAYLLLLQDYPATAYEISKRGAATKAGVYGALESLASKGAIQPVSASPVKYAPIDPERFFGQISRRTSDLCRDLASALAQPEKPNGKEYVWTLSGDAEVDGKVIDLIQRAQGQIWVKGSSLVMGRYADALRAAARRKVRILTILFGDEAAARTFDFGTRSRLYLHEGSGEVLATGNQQFVIAVDFGEALIANFGKRVEAAYTRSNGVVFLAETMIRHEVYMAEIMQAFGPQIEARFGHALGSIRSDLLPPALATELEKHLPRKPRAGRTAARPRHLKGV